MWGGGWCKEVGGVGVGVGVSVRVFAYLCACMRAWACMHVFPCMRACVSCLQYMVRVGEWWGESGGVGLWGGCLVSG